MRVLIADGDEHVRSALRLLLEQQPGLAIVAEAATFGRLLGELSTAQPDLVLLDWDLHGLDPGRLVPALRAAAPVSIVALSCRPEARSACRACGVDAFVSKSDPPDALLDVVRSLPRRDGSAPGTVAAAT